MAKTVEELEQEQPLDDDADEASRGEATHDRDEHDEQPGSSVEGGVVRL